MHAFLTFTCSFLAPNQDSIPHLGYVCEARVIETIRDEEKVESCRFPFVYNGTTHFSCVVNPEVYPEIGK